MQTFLNVVMYLSLGLMFVSMYQLVRVHFLSKAVQRAIDDTFNRRLDAQKAAVPGRHWIDIPYPNINATYKNLKWYKPWERPSTLLVYDKEN